MRRRRAGGDQQRVEADGLAVVEVHGARAAVDARDARPDLACHPQAVEVALVAGIELPLRNLLGQEVRQRHARVGALVGDERDRRRASKLANGLDGIDPGGPAADDDVM